MKFEFSISFSKGLPSIGLKQGLKFISPDRVGVGVNRENQQKLEETIKFYTEKYLKFMLTHFNDNI